MQTKNRYSYGQMVDQYPSRFLQEVQKLLPHEDFSYASLTHVYNFFAQWLQVGSKKSNDIFVPTLKDKSFVKTSSFRTPEPTPINSKSSWRKNQPVKHEKYGIGTIQEIEEKNAETTYLTVRFKASIKKILAQFLQRL